MPFCLPTESSKERVPEVREEEPEENFGSNSLIVNDQPQPPKDFSECDVLRYVYVNVKDHLKPAGPF